MFQLFLLFVAMIILINLPKYLMFKKSNYYKATGSGFFKTVIDSGSWGEFLTFYEIEKVRENALVLANLYITKKDNTTTEIDLLLVDSTGIYVFESKNYSGWIYGNETSKDWTQTLKSKHKNKFYNPIWQNRGHINALKNLLKVESNEVFKSYIVFSNHCELKKIKVVSDNVKVLKRGSLLKQLKAEIKNEDKIFDGNTLVQIYTLLRKHTMVDNVVKFKHIQDIKNKYSAKH